MRTLTADSHEALEASVAVREEPRTEQSGPEPSQQGEPREEAKLRVYRLPDRIQSSDILPFRDSGFVEVVAPPDSADQFKPGTLVKILAPAVMYLGAVVERVSGLLIVEVDLSHEYTPM